ncbi:hypothetical protein EA95_02922 [Enterococcus faecium]|nr:hypothetical protein EA95_02922 [Enterococcus faecium]
MNIIQQYELKYITFDQLSEEIWGYGQRLINEVGVERFSFYVEAPFLFLQIGVDTRIMRMLNYYCNRNNKRKKAYAPCLSIHLFTRTRSMFTLSRI